MPELQVFEGTNDGLTAKKLRKRYRDIEKRWSQVKTYPDPETYFVPNDCDWHDEPYDERFNNIPALENLHSIAEGIVKEFAISYEWLISGRRLHSHGHAKDEFCRRAYATGKHTQRHIAEYLGYKSPNIVKRALTRQRKWRQKRV